MKSECTEGIAVFNSLYQQNPIREPDFHFSFANRILLIMMLIKTQTRPEVVIVEVDNTRLASRCNACEFDRMPVIKPQDSVNGQAMFATRSVECRRTEGRERGRAF